MIALFIFEVGSVLCGAATNSTMLIVGRAVAGVGAAAIFSGGMTIVGYSVPLRKRPIYIGLLSSMFGIASVVGPILGGALTDRKSPHPPLSITSLLVRRNKNLTLSSSWLGVSWRWCFYINLPIGAIAITAVFFFFKNPVRAHSNLTLREKIGQIDLLGAFFLICSIVCLLLALQWGGTTYPWSNSKVWGSLLGFGLLISTFTGIQFWKGDLATLPPRIMLRQRTVFVCAFFSTFLAMGLYTHIYYLPFYFQAGEWRISLESLFIGRTRHSFRRKTRRKSTFILYSSYYQLLTYPQSRAPQRKNPAFARSPTSSASPSPPSW
jgi:MFS family permease